MGACTLSCYNEGNMNKNVLDKIQNNYKFTYTYETVTKDFYANLEKIKNE